MSSSEQQKPTSSGTNAYLIPHRQKRRTSHHNPRPERNNQSLPSIGIANTFPVKDQKVNIIRNQIDEKKNQITLLEARINALKFQKERNEKKKHSTKKQIQFLTTVRGRVSSDKAYKQNIREQKEKEREELRKQAEALREQMIRNREMAKSIMNEKKMQAADEQRMKKREDENHIHRVKSIQIAQNQLKAKNIKKEEMEIEEKNRIFYESRVSFAKSNHRERVERSMSERKKMDRILSRLKKKEESMLQECKKSEADMLSSLYELQTINPQRKVKGLKTSRTSSVFHFAD